MYLAIDFGTSFTSAAVVRNGQAPVMIKNNQDDDSDYFPSVMLIDSSGSIVFGSEARDQAEIYPDRFIKEIKLEISKKSIQLRGIPDRSFDVEELIGGFLQHIKKIAEKQINQGNQLVKLVLTIPIGFTKADKQLMAKAAQWANFIQVEFLAEPVAAGMFHIIEEGSELEIGDNVLIYDLGGGTFDTAIIQKKSTGYCSALEFKSRGTNRCGGSDFDTCIYEYLVTKISDHPKISSTNEIQLSQLAKKFKHQLSGKSSCGGVIPFGEGIVVKLERSEFEEMLTAKNYLEETCKLVGELLSDCEVSYILLVGGSCRIPYVKEQLQQFGIAIETSKDPQLAVAKGAAYYGHWLHTNAPQDCYQDALNLVDQGDFKIETINQALHSVERSLQFQPNFWKSQQLKGELLAMRGLHEMQVEWQRISEAERAKLADQSTGTKVLHRYLDLVQCNFPEYMNSLAGFMKQQISQQIAAQNIFKSPRTIESFAKELKIDLGGGVFLEMVYIKGGQFMMGAAPGKAEASADELPQHLVTVKNFYMAKYPTTQEQYEKITQENPSHFKGAKRPVESVFWYDAKEFCTEAAKTTGQKFQLPSEAQWEYACRAGTSSPFSFGETITPDWVNYDGNHPYGNAAKGQYRQETTNVGSFKPNAFGLYDMHGNVLEWCLDTWHGNYEGAPSTCAPWTSGNDKDSHLLRGGSWSSNARYCRSSYRDHGHVDLRSNHIGFRVVLPAQ
jgi:formylglycine-generating enzyme required for sulfatase activity/actin-like ATPase involved in cell morphogenesis